MRLTASVLAAAAFHGLLIGVAAAVLASQITPRPAPVTVEVEVLSPRPDPIADSAAAAAPAPTKKTAPPRPRMRAAVRPRAVALVSDTRARSPTVVSDLRAPTRSVLAAAETASASPVRARVSVRPGGNSLVSARPRYRTNPTPDYPLPCKRRREEGIVLLSVVVEANGLPSAISLNRSSGHPLLDKAALDAVRRWTFDPGRAAGLPVQSLVVVPVRFSLSERP